MKIKLIFGSDTGNTDHIVGTYVVNLLAPFEVIVTEVHNLKPKDWVSEDIIILGIPTWYDGDLQSDWEDYYEEFKKIDFTGKTIAIFGLGDQIGYSEFFVDGIGILAKVVLDNGGKIIGHWPTKGYDFEESKALVNEHYFYGLAIDEDNESDLTFERVDQWVKQLKSEIKEIRLNSKNLEIA